VPRSFITEQLAQKLNLYPQNTEKITIAGFGEHNYSVRNLKSDNVLLYTDDGKNIEMNVLIVPQIASPIQNNTRSVKHISHLKKLRLANPYTGDEKFEVEMLIGADYYLDVVEDKIICGDGPTVMKSKLGNLLSGTIRKNHDTNRKSTTMMNIVTYHKEEDCQLQKFWELESTGIEADMYKNSTLKQYQENCILYTGSRYLAKLPWKNEYELPSNKNTAKRRTDHKHHQTYFKGPRNIQHI
jgi:hypothetical protein